MFYFFLLFVDRKRQKIKINKIVVVCKGYQNHFNYRELINLLLYSKPIKQMNVQEFCVQNKK